MKLRLLAQRVDPRVPAGKDSRRGGEHPAGHPAGARLTSVGVAVLLPG